MKLTRILCAIAGLVLIAASAEAQRGGGRSLTFYGGPDFSGPSVTITDSVANFQSVNFNDQAMSIRIQGGGSWTVCQHSNYRGVCRVITSDVYDLTTISLNGHISSARREAVSGDRPGGGGNRPGRDRSLTFFGATNFTGPSVTISADVTNFQAINFNDRALSIRVEGGGSWTVCQHSDFRGVCREISSDVPNLATISLDGHISSARMEYGAGRRPGGGRPGRGDGSLTLYTGPNFTGQSVNIDRETYNLSRLQFNDRTRSAEVHGRGRWTICEDANFGSPCRTISGRIADLNSFGLANRVSSVRPEDDQGGGYGGNYGNDGTLILFSGPNFTGQSIELDREESNFLRRRFNDQAMSAIVNGGSWTVCEDTNFGTPCRQISGRIRNLNSIGLGNLISSARPDALYGGPGGGYGGPGGGGYGQYSAITLYAGPNFTGQSITVDRDTYNLTGLRFNDRAMSVEVSGYGSWVLCEHANFGGRCQEFDRDVANLNYWGLGNRVSSIRSPNASPKSGYR